MNEWIRQAILLFTGLCCGGVIAAGLFSFIVSIGVMTRIIGKSHTEKHIRLFEDCMTAGVTLGNLVNLYDLQPAKWLPFWAGILILVLQGLCAGIFAGVLVMSLAETLNVFPVAVKNIHLMHGMKYIIAALAVGKAAGALVDFWLVR